MNDGHSPGADNLVAELDAQRIVTLIGTRDTLFNSFLIVEASTRSLRTFPSAVVKISPSRPSHGIATGHVALSPGSAGQAKGKNLPWSQGAILSREFH